jgi:hypothetical protein
MLEISVDARFHLVQKVGTTVNVAHGVDALAFG